MYKSSTNAKHDGQMTIDGLYHNDEEDLQSVLVNNSSISSSQDQDSSKSSSALGINSSSLRPDNLDLFDGNHYNIARLPSSTHIDNTALLKHEFPFELNNQSFSQSQNLLKARNFDSSNDIFYNEIIDTFNSPDPSSSYALNGIATTSTAEIKYSPSSPSSSSSSSPNSHSSVVIKQEDSASQRSSSSFSSLQQASQNLHDSSDINMTTCTTDIDYSQLEIDTSFTSHLFTDESNLDISNDFCFDIQNPSLSQDSSSSALGAQNSILQNNIIASDDLKLNSSVKISQQQQASSSSSSSTKEPENKPSLFINPNGSSSQNITESSKGSPSNSLSPTSTSQNSEVKTEISRIEKPFYMPDFNPNDWKLPSDLKYKIQIKDSPVKSRVETQIKIFMDFYPPPTESMIHLPTDTISKPKLQLKEPFTPMHTALSLDTIVVCDSDPEKFVNICKCCLNRERKRAFRKKVRLPAEEEHWSLDKEKRAIVFNCKEIVDFGPLIDIEVDGKMVKAKRLELPIRMACYCRHHNEKMGFRALFVIRDYLGNVVGRCSTTSIMITDDHKAASSKTKANVGVKRHNSEMEVAEDNMPPQSNQASPTPSPRELSELMPRKKKASDTPLATVAGSPATPSVSNSLPQSRRPSSQPKASYHRSRGSITSISSNVPSADSSPTSFTLNIRSPFTPSSPPSTAIYPHSPNPTIINDHRSSSFVGSPNDQGPLASISNQVLTPTQTITEDLFSQLTGTPEIEKIIPQTGPIRGGIEVSLFGSNFINGLVPKFGENKALATKCWSPSSIVTQLPPSKFPGPVIVTFEGLTMSRSEIFSYYDDTDRQLIELALRVVGVKMNGKLEDVRDIARRIVGTGTGYGTSFQTLGSGGSNGATNHGNSEMPIDRLESLLMSCVELVDSCDNGIQANWQLRNNEGQALLHLAASLGLNRFCSTILEHGAHVDIQDRNGYTPLHFAALHDQKDIVADLLRHKADPSIRTFFGQTYQSLFSDANISQNKSVCPSSQSMFVFKAADDEYDDEEDEDSEISFDENEFESDVIEKSSTPKSQSDFIFKDAGETDDDYEDDNWSDELQDDDDTNIDENSQQTLQTFTELIGSFIPYFRKSNFDGSDTSLDNSNASSSSIWGIFGNQTTENRTSNDSTMSSPPNYFDLFPEGSNSNPDYSGAVLDEEKEAIQKTIDDLLQESSISSGSQMLSNTFAENKEDETETDVVPDSDDPTEEEVVELWRSNRKKIQNDRMFLFFWLPVFIFILVWVGSRTISYMDKLDTTKEGIREGATYLAKKIFGFSNHQQRLMPQNQV